MFFLLFTLSFTLVPFSVNGSVILLLLVLLLLYCAVRYGDVSMLFLAQTFWIFSMKWVFLGQFDCVQRAEVYFHLVFIHYRSKNFMFMFRKKNSFSPLRGCLFICVVVDIRDVQKADKFFVFVVIFCSSSLSIGLHKHNTPSLSTCSKPTNSNNNNLDEDQWWWYTQMMAKIYFSTCPDEACDAQKFMFQSAFVVDFLLVIAIDGWTYNRRRLNNGRPDEGEK